jgi:hypothetical protein
MEKIGEENREGELGRVVVDERGSNVCNLVYLLVGQHIP